MHILQIFIYIFGITRETKYLEAEIMRSKYREGQYK
jgi:hypothetical protein